MPAAGLRHLAVSSVAALALLASGARAVTTTPVVPVGEHAASVTTQAVSDGDRATFVPMAPYRVLDTRKTSKMAAKATRTVTVAGVGGVPGDALAVVVNVTALSATRSGYLLVWPAGTAKPPYSNLFYGVHQTVANLATVKLGGGKVSVYNGSLGLTHAVMDVVGYYRAHAHDDRYLPKADAQARTADGAFSCPVGQYMRAVAADGTTTCVPDVSGGEGATYVGGFGISIAGNTISAEQGRSAGGAFFCASGTYLRAVAADGAPTCATDATGTTFTTGLGLLLSNGVLSAEQSRGAVDAFTCPVGQYLRVVAADGAPTCAQDVDTDTDTTYEPGFGLYLEGNVFAAEQGRSAKDAFWCEEGLFLREVAADGTPTCAPDNDTDTNTTYAAGFGLTLTGTTFSAQQGRSAPTAFTCPAGQYLRAVAADGAPTCATDTNTTYTAGPGITIGGGQIGAAHGPTVVPVRGDGTPAANGTALRNAMAAIGDATAEKPYVVSLAPGTFDLGTLSFTMKPNVSVVGAGRGVTILKGSLPNESGGLVNLGNNTTLARLTVSNVTSTSSTGSTGIMANGAVTARVVDVDSTGEGGGENYGLLAFSGATITAANSSFTGRSATSLGVGIYAISGSTVRARGVEAYSLAPSGYSLYTVNVSTIEFADGYAKGAARRGSADSGALRIAHSRLEGGSTGGVQCFGVHDAAWAAATCG